MLPPHPPRPILTLTRARPRVGLAFARSCERGHRACERAFVRARGGYATTCRKKRKDVDLTERNRNLSVKAC
jgi:hypothetical protein